MIAYALRDNHVKEHVQNDLRFVPAYALLLPCEADLYRREDGVRLPERAAAGLLLASSLQ